MCVSMSRSLSVHQLTNSDKHEHKISLAIHIVTFLDSQPWFPHDHFGRCENDSKSNEPVEERFPTTLVPGDQDDSSERFMITRN